MKRILITGANGFLGQKLVQLFSQKDDIEIIATGNGPARIPRNKHTYVEVDLANKFQVFDKIKKASPTHIIHAAAMTQVDLCETEKDRCWQNNVMASENLIELAIQLNAYFQFISTDFVFDGKAGPYKESDIPNPINFYGKSKHAVEQMLTRTLLNYSIIRTVLVYGVCYDRTKSNIVLWVKNKLESGEAINVVDDQWRSPTLVEDLAIGCKLAVDTKATGIFHISGEEYITPYEIALQTADVFGLNKKLISPTDGSKFKETASRPLKTGFDISKAKKELGFEPTSLLEGLKKAKSQLA